MVLVEYTESAEDHRCVLLLVQHVGSHLHHKVFTKLYERVSKIQIHRIPSQKRTIHLRYKRQYPPSSSAWGEFQAHRRVLGIIALGACDSSTDLPELYKLYEGVKEQYGNTLYDSRLIVFGLDSGKTDRDVTSTEQAIEDKESVKTSDDPEKEPSDLASPMSDPSDPDRLSLGSTGGQEKDSGKGDSLDSRSSVLLHGLQNGGTEPADGGLGAEGGESTESETSEEDQTDFKLSLRNQSKLPISRSNNAINSDLSQTFKTSSDELNTAASIEASTVTKKSDLLTASPLAGTKPRSSTASSDASSTASVKDAPPHVLFYPDVDRCPDLEDKVTEFIDSLFWVLESKRLDRSQEKLDKLPMLAAPFEKKDLVGVDTDGRVYKKRCQGRLKKQQGDLCLLAGLPGEAIMHYNTAADILKSANDWLWLGASQEGLCSAYVIAASLTKLEPVSGLTRNRSFSLKRGTSADKEAGKMNTGTLRGVPNGLDLGETRSHLPDDLSDRYKDAVSYYAKYKHAAVIEMEASIKACKVLARQEVRRWGGCMWGRGEGLGVRGVQDAGMMLRFVTQSLSAKF